MDTTPRNEGLSSGYLTSAIKRWMRHDGHKSSAPALLKLDHGKDRTKLADFSSNSKKQIVLDGSRGEGGGQILRTALTLSLLTGSPFRITRIRANRDNPGLRPQHLAAVEAAAQLGDAELQGNAVGSSELMFRPRPFEARDLHYRIGTAGATSLVLHTLYLPMALRARSGVRLTIEGGTFNQKAPSYPFLESAWRRHAAAIGLTIGLKSPTAGFYPQGQGKLEAWIEPATLQPMVKLQRGPLVAIRGVSGVARLPESIADRMRDRAQAALQAYPLEVEPRIETEEWRGGGPGAAIALTAEFADSVATFVGLGERGKPAEQVADEAVAELLAFLNVPDAAVDPHSADQILLPLALAEGPSAYTVTEVTEHLRTNVATIQEFIDREIRIEESDEGPMAKVVIAS